MIMKRDLPSRLISEQMMISSFLTPFNSLPRRRLLTSFAPLVVSLIPFVDLQTVVAAETLYFESLVLNRLTVSADSDIPVNHTRYYVKLMQT